MKFIAESVHLGTGGKGKEVCDTAERAASLLIDLMRVDGFVFTECTDDDPYALLLIGQTITHDGYTYRIVLGG